MPDTLITVLGVALAVALAFWFLGGLIGFLRRTLFLVVGEDARHRRLLRAAPTIPIGKAADGEPVKIIGTIVLLDPPAASPLSGKSVAYAVVMIDQPASGTPVHRHVQRATFAVQDETGTVIVPAASARLRVATSTTKFSGGIDDPKPSPSMRALLAKKGRAPEDYLRLRYTESTLEAGQRVCVYGVLRSEVGGGAEGGYRSATVRRIVEAGPNVPVLVSDEPAALDS